MERIGNKIFIYVGLSLLAIAFAIKWFGAPMFCFWILLGAAILFKVFFLIVSLRSKSVTVGLWLYLILAGVAMILASMLFKNIFQNFIVRIILFHGAILLKITGLILMLLDKKKRK